MKLKKIKIKKTDERGVMYDCDKLYFIERKKGSISANHSHSDSEILYLLRGKISLLIDKEKKFVKAPIKIDIPSNKFHKLVATTDIIILEDRENE